MVPLTLPPVWVSEVVVPQVAPSLATSKPAGAETATSLVRLDPVRAKVWAAEGTLVVAAFNPVIFVGLATRPGGKLVIAPLTARELLAEPLTWLMEAE